MVRKLKEFSASRVITARIGKRMQEIAKEGGYLKQEIGHVSDAPRIILKQWQTSLTEEQSESFQLKILYSFGVIDNSYLPTSFQ